MAASNVKRAGSTILARSTRLLRNCICCSFNCEKASCIAKYFYTYLSFNINVIAFDSIELIESKELIIVKKKVKKMKKIKD